MEGVKHLEVFPWALWFSVLIAMNLHLCVVTFTSPFSASSTLLQLLCSLVGEEELIEQDEKVTLLEEMLQTVQFH